MVTRSCATVDNLVQLWSYVHMTPPTPKRYGIRRAYTALGYTRKRFAERVGVAPQTLLNIVNGAGISDATAVRIGKALGWTDDEVRAGERSDQSSSERGAA
jgi:DNA-binding XRE family transcriptional regulator